ncbi:hypothetical protein PUMCH_004494 [Australozyma saopauloensis]|uniref:Acid phosphatase n=1 Tax=Australozyma saopauloensis TaxID=291208 RepID=A0AAX4HFD7_9ASCO|nr:hypothetical protein PUMCH_004494 [[Candida] saopauloensis]
MVSVSKLLNNGLLLASQGVFRDVATPDQASVESYNYVRFLGGAGPYVQHPGYGISTDIPEQCTLEQVHLLSRHGERYPSTKVGVKLEAIWAKVKSYNQTFKGELAFFNDYTYFVPKKELYEKEVSAYNSEGTFAGTTNAVRHGVSFRSKYNTLFNSTTEKLNVFTSNSGRCHETARYFARGFLGDQYSEKAANYYILAENLTMGANSLTPRKACANFDDSINDHVIEKYDDSYLEGARDRLLKKNKNFNLTKTDVFDLFSWCAFETNVRGSSQVCSLFTNEEYVKYAYSLDIDNYYSHGPGHNASAVIAAPYLNATTQFLNEENPKYKVVLAFTHDTDLELHLAGLGLVGPENPLPVDEIPFPSPYSHVQICPQGARLVTEKYKCGNESYVRIVLNDAVIPIKGCKNGPGFSCKLSDYNKYIQGRIGGIDYKSQCGIGNAPEKVTFLWDYASKNYTAPDINK